MLFATESNSNILFSLLKPVFDVFVLLYQWLQIRRKFCIFCRELTAILSIFGRKQIHSLMHNCRPLAIWVKKVGITHLPTTLQNASRFS